MKKNSHEVPEGAAVFPTTPADLGIHPLLLAVLHATVFLAGSEEAIVHPAAADEAVESIAGYLRMLSGRRLQEVQEDIDCLVSYARSQQWPRPLIGSLESFLRDCGISTKKEES